MSIKKKLIELLNQILYLKTKSLTNSSISDNDVLIHYKNILSIIINTEQFSLTKILLLIEDYLRTINSVREHYEYEETNYITIHSTLRKTLFEEISLLKKQGASSIYSRLLFLTASLNPLIPSRVDLSKYYANLNNILSIPVPPSASEAKIIDLLLSTDTIGIVPGSIYSTWVLETLVNELISNQNSVEIIVCRENYDYNINVKNIYRLMRECIDNKLINLKETSCLRISSLKETDYLIICNNLAIYNILDNIDKFGSNTSSNYLIVFNPLNTVLVENFGIAPVVISISTLKNILFEINNK